MTPVGKSLGKICLLIVDVSLNHSCFTTFSIISFPIISTLQIPPKAMAQAPQKEQKCLLTMLFKPWKLMILKNQQYIWTYPISRLPTFVNSTSFQSVEAITIAWLSDISCKRCESQLLWTSQSMRVYEKFTRYKLHWTLCSLDIEMQYP